jgi:hypothetical protein
MSRRPSLSHFTAAITIACGALALWVSFGALSFVDVDDRASYVGVLRSPVWLAVLLSAAAAVVVFTRPSPRDVAPIWLSAVLLLPWLPLPLPLSVLIWVGNIAIWVWAAVVVALLIPIFERIARSGSMARLPPRRAAWLSGLLAAVAFGLGTWSVAPRHPDGDEPHYLIITQSILADHDLKIENNHRQGDYRVYVSRTLKPDFLKRGQDNQIYSIHAPGLSLLVAPAFALFGYPGVLVALCLVSAAASALVWLTSWRVTGNHGAGWFAWAAFALSVPFFFHSSAIFPDGPGAILLALALLPLVDERGREPGPLFAVGAALALLPWLSSRFVSLSAMFALVIAVRLLAHRSRRAFGLAALAACPLTSAIAFFLFFQLIYGTPNPSVVYGNSPTMSMTAGNLVRGVPGLMFDQQFGLIPNAPVYLCTIAGFAVMLWRGPRRLAVELLMIAVPYFLVAASFTSWWGGTTAPARYVAPITPLLVVPAAVWFATAKGVVARTAGLGALVVSVLLTATMAWVDRGAFVFNFRDGMSRIAVWLSPVADLTTALPSLFQNAPRDVLLHAGLWLSAIAIAVAVSAAVGRGSRAAAILGFGLTFEIAAMVAVSFIWQSNDAVVATPHVAGPLLLQRYPLEVRQIAVAYRPFHRLQPTDLPGRIVLARILAPTPQANRESMPRLPAGMYEVAGTTVGPRGGRFRLRTDQASPPIVDWNVASFDTNWKKVVALPVGVIRLEMDPDAAARNSLRDVSLRWASPASPPEDLRNREAKAGARYGPLVVFLLSGEAWVEPGGIWVAGGSKAEFAVASDAQTPVRLAIRSGALDNVVTVESRTWRRRFEFKPGDETVVQLPIDGRSQATPLRVSATSGFRPVDVDPNSEDARFLGVRIESR